MSQHTLNTDVNTALAALGSTMKGPGVPPAPLAGMLWLDDSAAPWALKIYDGADWIPVGTVDASTNVFIADGLAAGRFFAPRPNDTPNMKLRLNAGIVFDPATQTLTGVVSQETATLTAPSSDPRKDIVYIDRLTGILGVATGMEAASPADPAIPAGKLPVARINWTAGATAITAGMIDDIRVLNALGLGALAVQNFITDVPENFSLSGFLTPPTITATQDDYNPSGLATVSTLRLSANAAHSITGLAGGTPGRILIVHNMDAGNITLENEHTGSSATNRFALNSDITLAFNQAAILQYDHISDRWRAIAYQPNGIASGGLSRSLRFNGSDSAYLSRTPGGAGNRTTSTLSFWVKRSKLTTHQIIFSGGVSEANYDIVRFSTGAPDDVFEVYGFESSAYAYRYVTTPVFRDPSSWAHVVVIWDTTNGTASDRVRTYYNGVRITAFSIGTNPSTGYNVYFNTANPWNFGRFSILSSTYLDAYLADIHFIDGQALDPTAFGEFDENGTWMPRAYEGTYGTNGFRLDFSDNSGTTSTTLGKDRSGNNNDWTPNNFSVAAGPGNDSLIDVPVNYDDSGNGRGNYCTLDPLDKSPNGLTHIALSDGNLKSSASNDGTAGTTFMPSSSKWYYEVLVESGHSPVSNTIYTGVVSMSPSVSGVDGDSVGGRGRIYRSTGQKSNNGAGSSYGSTYTNADIVGVAFDIDDGKIWFSKNGTWQASGDPAAGTNAAFTDLAGASWMPVDYHNGAVLVFNFGQRPFAYPAPEGFKALNTQNLPAPAIAKPTSYVNPALYTGNGSTQTITGIGFQPDLVWLKSRSNSLDHKLTDAIRGITKGLEANTGDAESTDTNGVTAFTGDGFSLGSDAIYNTNAAAYVAWNWKTGVTPGFDILSYTGDGNAGRTVSHGLGVAPAFVIVKNRTDSSTDWAVWHQALANTEALNLNAQAGKFTATTYWNSTTPGASVLTLGNSALVNASTKSYVAYLWAEVAGFSRFGSYTGNGSSDGPFIWCGFRPKFVLTKRADTVGHWWVTDGARNTYNVANLSLYADGGSVEESGADTNTDHLANGFKLRDSSARRNQSSGTYLFAAFAENPFKTARAR